MLKTLSLTLAAVAAATMFGGCSTAPKLVRHPLRMQLVRKIAVAGFVVSQERKPELQQVWRPADGWRAHLDANDLYAEWVSLREPVQIENIYLALGTTLERELRLSVVAPSTIV